jgi:hypothetical protein
VHLFSASFLLLFLLLITKFRHKIPRFHNIITTPSSSTHSGNNWIGPMGCNASFSPPGSNEKNMGSEDTGQRVLEKQTHPEKTNLIGSRKAQLNQTYFYSGGVMNR